MILTEHQQWVDLYESIKAETRKSAEKHVNIYVSATDADSVCSLRILEVCDLLPPPPLSTPLLRCISA